MKFSGQGVILILLAQKYVEKRMCTILGSENSLSNPNISKHATSHKLHGNGISHKKEQ